MLSDAYTTCSPTSRGNRVPLQWRRGLIPYERHFAYSELIEQATLAAKGKALARFGSSLLPLTLKRLIKYELIPLELRKPKTPKESAAFATAALRNVLGLRSSSKASRALSTETQQEAVLEGLRGDGCTVVSMPSSRFTELSELARPHFEALENRRAATSGDKVRVFDESRAVVDKRTSGTELFDAINRVLAQAGVLGAVQGLLGRPVRLVDINPQINDNSDGFWREVFADLKLATIPKSSYFHRDASGGDIKAIIYFSDVGSENGPFSYVVGSHRMGISRIDDLICEANDHNGFSGTDLKSRASFAALPRVFRQKCAFGNDVPDGSSLADWMAANAWTIEGKAGSIVLFDTKGIHRGGMVRSGQRRVITCVIG